MPGFPAQNGMKFTTPDMDYDLRIGTNCASMYGGSFWYSNCALWAPTIPYPVWYNRGDSTGQSMDIVHMMVKLQ